MTQPIRTTEWLVEYASPWSAWWLLLLVPILIVAGYRLYMMPYKGVKRSQVLALAVLRVAILVLLCCLIFRPSLHHRTEDRYPGRFLFVVDDSRSMTTTDIHMPVPEALRIHRSLSETSEGQPQAFHDMAELLWQAEDVLRSFETAARDLDPEEEAYWEIADAKATALENIVDDWQKLEQAAAPTGEGMQALWSQLKKTAPEALRRASALVNSREGQDRKAREALFGKLTECRGQLHTLQRASDNARVETAGGKPPSEADAVRKTSRLSLLSKKLQRMLSKKDLLPANQTSALISLQTGKEIPLDQLQGDGKKAEPGQTDVIGRMLELVKPESEFPISAVIYCGDGRAVPNREREELTSLLAQRQIPVLCAGVGSVTEPPDAAVVQLSTPPFAVKQSRVTARALLKMAGLVGKEAQARLMEGKKALATLPVYGKKRERQRAELSFQPEELGLKSWLWQLTAPAGEVFPRENNSIEFAVEVRSEKVRVLLVDKCPRWQTRFLINTLLRLDYLDLNVLVVDTLEGGELKRGVQRGTYPQDEATLDMYDLVILGDLPADTLSRAEGEQLVQWVNKKGKTICFLAPESVPSCAKLSPPLWPLDPKGYAINRRIRAPLDLQLTQAGRFHPLTSAFAGELQSLKSKEAPGVLADTQLLMADGESGAALLACRQVGAGKSVLLGSDRLWKALNPTLLEAHQRMVVELVTWGVRRNHDIKPEEKVEPILCCDRRVLHTGEPLQVWVRGKEPGAVVEARNGDDRIHSAKVTRHMPDSKWGHAVFADLPGGRMRLQLKDDPKVKLEPVVVLERDEELSFLARDVDFLDELAGGSGGASGDFTEMEHLLPGVNPKQNIKRFEDVWRLWDSTWVLAFCVVALALEWAYRKWVGLV